MKSRIQLTREKKKQTTERENRSSIGENSVRGKQTEGGRVE